MLIIWNCFRILGPVVQSVVSLTSSLRVISLTIVADSIYITFWYFLLKKCDCKSYSHFFSKKFQHICVSLDVNFNKSLTNDIVSFEQLGSGWVLCDQNCFKLPFFYSFPLIVPRRFLSCNSSLYVRLWFNMWCLFCPYLCLIFLSFGASGSLVFPGYLHFTSSRKHAYIISTPLNPTFI